MWTVKSHNSWKTNPEMVWESTSVGSVLGRHQLPSEGPHPLINPNGSAACLLWWRPDENSPHISFKPAQGSHTLGHSNSMVMQLPTGELAGVLQLRGGCGREIALNYILSLLHKFQANSLKFAPTVGLGKWGNFGSLADNEERMVCSLCQRAPTVCQQPSEALEATGGCHLMEPQLRFKTRGLSEKQHPRSL